jgi:histone demethylase JARID1
MGSYSPTVWGSTSLPVDVPIKPVATTFTSSLDIPVQGAIPINPDPSDEVEQIAQPDISLHTATGDPTRAPRKSKTDALAALQTHAQSSSSSDIEMQSLESGIRYSSGGRPIPVSPILDMSSVKTRSPRNMPSDGPKRPFGLEDCPVFYPTIDEFKDPMAYVRSISTTAQNYGICKIVPPVGWKMPFVTDTEVRQILLCNVDSLRSLYCRSGQ